MRMGAGSAVKATASGIVVVVVVVVVGAAVVGAGAATTISWFVGAGLVVGRLEKVHTMSSVPPVHKRRMYSSLVSTGSGMITAWASGSGVWNQASLSRNTEVRPSSFQRITPSDSRISMWHQAPATCAWASGAVLPTVIGAGDAGDRVGVEAGEAAGEVGVEVV